MNDIINTLLISCIPAIVTGVVTFVTSNKNAKTKISALQESNKHEIEIMGLEHRNALESKEKEQSDAAMFGMMADIMREPKKFKAYWL